MKLTDMTKKNCSWHAWLESKKYTSFWMGGWPEKSANQKRFCMWQIWLDSQNGSETARWNMELVVGRSKLELFLVKCVVVLVQFWNWFYG